MRAVVLELKKINVGEILIISGDKAHHLCHVIRIGVGETIKILSGGGQVAICSISSVNAKKNEVHVQVLSIELFDLRNKLSLAVGLTKKDDWDLVVKQAVELGIWTLLVVASDFSQRWEIKADRMTRLIESAMEQSNNPHFLKWEMVSSIEEIDFSHFDEVLFFSTETEKNKTEKINGNNQLILIGPEGGWSEREIKFLISRSNVKVVNIHGPIMRTTTAVSFASGFTCKTKCDIL